MKAVFSELSDEELLSTFIPKDVANKLMKEYQSIYGVVMNTAEIDTKNLRGFGKNKLDKIACIKEIIYRINMEKSKALTQISSPNDVLTYFKDMEDLRQEEIRLIMLNTKNKIIAHKTISKGTINSSVVTPREIFFPAIKMMASSIILAHNHPSADVTPSSEDKNITEIVARSGKLINIKLLDHIIIGKNKIYSFKEAGLIP
jgi:DNA repair protein RadC